MHLHLAYIKKMKLILDSLRENHFLNSEPLQKRDAGYLLNLYNSLNLFEKIFQKFSGFVPVNSIYKNWKGQYTIHRGGIFMVVVVESEKMGIVYDLSWFGNCDRCLHHEMI